MIGTLSTTPSNSSCSSNEHHPPSPSTRPRRFTLHSIASRLSDSKKNFLEQIPHHQQQLTRFRKRAKSFLSSTLIDHLSDIHSSSERRNSTSGVYRSTLIPPDQRRKKNYLEKFIYLDHQCR
jgi:hypothetical protein